MKISIIGAAGTLGSCIAFYIGANRLADDIVLIDPWEGMLKSHWMDLINVASMMGISIHKGRYEDLPGTNIVIVTSAAPSRVVQSSADLLQVNFSIIRENAENICKYSPDAIVITESNPVDGLNYSMYLMSKDKDRRKYIGYSLNDTIRFQRWSAEILGIKSSQVKGIVIGEHGSNQVMLFSTLTVNGKPFVLDETFKSNLKELPAKNFKEMESLNPKRTFGWTCAVGTVDIIRAIKNNTREIIPCNALLQGEYGYQHTTCGVPVVIGENGIEEIKVIKLEADEEEGLRKSIQALRPQMRYVEAQLGIER